MANGKDPTTYKEFWPYYLKEHSAVNTRRLHYLGTTLFLCTLVLAVLYGQPSLLVLGLVAGNFCSPRSFLGVYWQQSATLILFLQGYGPAWVGHFFVECNRPATFKYPVWSLVSDFRMLACWLLGTINTELAKASVLQP